MRKPDRNIWVADFSDPCIVFGSVYPLIQAGFWRHTCSNVYVHMYMCRRQDMWSVDPEPAAYKFDVKFNIISVSIQYTLLVNFRSRFQKEMEMPPIPLISPDYSG